jgi:hypothetical protein
MFPPGLQADNIAENSGTILKPPEYHGQSVVRKVWNGRANLEEFQASCASHIEGLTLRLYNPESRQWDQA